MASIKELLREWRDYESRLCESQLYGQDAANFLTIAFNAASKTQSNDRTELSFDDFVREVVLAVSKSRDMGKKLFVSFVDKYDDSAPKLGVSPHITFSTPHGIYGYPLDNKNVYRLLTTGSPTGSDFAVDRDYMHVYTISDIDMISIDPSKKKPTDYDNRKFERDAETMTKMIVRFLLRIIDKDLYEEEIVFEAQNPSEDLKRLIDTGLVDYDSLSSDYEEVSYLFLSYIYYLASIENNSESEIVRKVKNAALNLSNTDNNLFAAEAVNDKFYNLYYMAMLYSRLPELADGKGYNHANAGAIYSLLLNGVGINAIDDSKGSSTIHRNEPSQSVVIDLNNVSGENRGYNLIGTYRSPESYYNSQQGSSRQVDKIIDEILANGEVSIDDVYPPGFDHRLSKRHSDNDVNDIKIEDLLQHVSASVRPGAEAIVSMYDSELGVLSGDFNDAEHLKLSNMFNEILEDLKEYCDNANEQYRSILIEKGTNEKIVNEFLNPPKYLNSFFTKIMYSLGFYVCNKEYIGNKILKNGLFQTQQSKVNFVNFLKVIHESIVSTGNTVKDSHVTRKKYINFLIEIFGIKTSLVENRQTKRIKNVYSVLFD